MVTMLPNTEHVIDVRTSDDGTYANAKEGSYHIDSSTISPIAAQDMGNHDNPFVVADAPVSGGVPGAVNGTLTFMVGCSEEHFDTIKELLNPMAGNVFHCGAAGSGQAAKICNNMCLAVQMTTIAEGLVLG